MTPGIDNPATSSGLTGLEVDVTKWGGAAIATPSVAGVPEVDPTHWLGTAAASPTVAGVPEVDLTRWVGVAPDALVSGHVVSQTDVMIAGVANQIRDTILSDATRFAGANIDIPVSQARWMELINDGVQGFPAAPAANGTNVASDSDIDSFGAYVEFRDASGVALLLVGVSLRGGGTDARQIQLATGNAGSEVKVTDVPSYRPNGYGDDTGYVPLPIPVPVAASTRIAARASDNNGSAITYAVILNYIEEADLRGLTL